MITACCILEAHHKLPELDEIDLDSPEGTQKLTEWSKLHELAHIVTLRLTEEQAERIRERLWPAATLLGATCGHGFSIETPEQVAVINEILRPDFRIQFDQRHDWMLQTFPSSLSSV